MKSTVFILLSLIYLINPILSASVCQKYVDISATPGSGVCGDIPGAPCKYIQDAINGCSQSTIIISVEPGTYPSSTYNPLNKTISILNNNSSATTPSVIIDMTSSTSAFFHVDEYSSSAITIKGVTFIGQVLTSTSPLLTVVITNCEFQNSQVNGGLFNIVVNTQSAVQSGAMYFTGSTFLSTVESVNGSVIYNNAALNISLYQCTFSGFNGGANSIAYLTGGNIDFTNTIISNSSSDHGVIYFYSNPNVGISNQASLSMTNVTFETSQSGIGVFLEGHTTSNLSSKSFTDCTFRNNIDSIPVYVYQSSLVSFSSCSFDGNSNSLSNSTNQLASGISIIGSYVNINENCSFTNNVLSESAGGAISITESSTSTSSTISITGSSFEGNKGINGSSISIKKSNLVLQSISFKNNKAENMGSIIYCETSVLNITQITYSNNTQSFDGLNPVVDCSSASTSCVINSDVAKQEDDCSGLETPPPTTTAPPSSANSILSSFNLIFVLILSVTLFCEI